MIKPEELQKSLAVLAEVFVVGGDSPYKASFDELMREHEFGLALHSVCDYLVAEGLGLITPDRIELVKELHSAMQVQDNCVSELEDARAQASQNANDAT